MIKTTLLLITTLLLSACINKHGVSLKYYSDCKEYYDLQGYYHKECGKDDIFTYDGVSDGIDELFEDEDEKKGNVY